jgi:hypothetical protein
MATVKEFTRMGLPPQTHAYDDPDLTPIEFLQAVYRDSSLPMSIRIDAARGALPFTEPRPASSPSSHVGCKIIIPPLSLEPWSHICSPWPREGDRASGCPECASGPTRNHSENLLSASITIPHDAELPAPQNLTTNPEPSTFIDYSTPPTPAELQEIKAAINRLRPDLAHLPIPELHLCRCGHWMFGPCPLGERCCDRTKPN